MADANLVHMIQQLKQEWSKMRLDYLDLQKAVDATIMELTQDIVELEKRVDALEQDLNKIQTR